MKTTENKRDRRNTRTERRDFDEPMTHAPADLDVRALPRAPEDDFFCVRYQVWYPSFDCAIRTRFRTSEGCANCDQGRFNERRHAAALEQVRFHAAGDPPDDEGEELSGPLTDR